ncbi:hypothetical protein CBR_g44402 [Chara braunii]|uniref:Reverse transcriptase RNase H-like domain-containing protein n=1 Tax=Chara braunii TaxID=69332 RepID=A0A388LXJ6_CHABU|nr:hypothetical protein CBR_g44402 [Chara braunii]|eukprot:GBG86949.1 hypothetical protein CBR_g44402 [Chara braunii]
MVKGSNARQSRVSFSAGDGEVTTTVVLREMLNRIEAMKTGMDTMNVRLDLPRAKVPPENIPSFDGTKVREFLEDYDVFGMSHGWSDKQKLKALLAYIEPKMRVSVTKTTQGLTTWVEVRQKMLEEYAKYDVPTTMQNLLDVRRSKYATLDQFLEDFERVARRVPFLGEAQKCHVLLTNFAEDERKSVVSRAAHYPLKWDEVVEMVRELPSVSNRKWSLEQMKAITSAREGNVEAATGGNFKAEEILGLLVKLGSFEKLTLPAPATQALVGAEEGKEERKKERQKEESESESESSDEEDARRKRKERQKKKRDWDWKKDNKSRDWQRRDDPFRCYYYDEEGYTITRCPILEKKLEEGIVKKNVNGHVCDANWNKIDFRVKGGMRAVILEQARANKDKKKKARVNVITFDGMLPPVIVARDDNPGSQSLNVSYISQKEVEEKKREKAQRELDQLIDGTKDLVKEGKGKEAIGKKRRVVLRSEAEEGISIDEVMEDICPEVTFPYIDDNPVKEPKEKDETLVDGRVRRFVWELAQGVAKVLEMLFKYNLTASGLKSLLFQREVTILGFRCFLEGRSPDPKKVDKILNWPMPLRMVGEVRSFLGVCSFWRIFIPGFARIVEPLREMVRQGASLEWFDQREKVARMLQDKLRDGGVVLGVTYFDDERERPFIIEADGGPIALRGVLVQRDDNGKERPHRFESRTLNSVERGYIQFRKELLAILHCLRVFRHYIMERRFILRTDSTTVIGAVKRHQQVDATISRWIAHIWTYDFILEKVPTDKNRADGLSRVEWGSIDNESLEEAPFVDEFLMGDNDAPNCYTASAMATSREDCWGEKEDPYLHYLLIQEDEEEGWYGMVEHAAVAAHELAESSTMAERRLNEIDDGSEDLEQSKDDEGRFRKEEYDGEYKRIGMVMSSNHLNEFYHERTKRTFRLRRGHLFVDAKEGLPPPRVVCGREKQLEVIAALHEGLAGGHRGADTTYYKVSRLCHWDGLRDMVMRYCTLQPDEDNGVWYDPAVSGTEPADKEKGVCCIAYRIDSKTASAQPYRVLSRF